MPSKPVDLRNLTPQKYEEIAAMAVHALCTIANYEDPEKLRADEEREDDDAYDDGDDGALGYGLDPNEVIEMAYDNVLSTARTAIDVIAKRLNETQGKNADV